MQKIIALLLFALSQNAVATERIDHFDWQLKKQANDIQVFRAVVPGSDHRAFLAETTLDSNINTLVSLLRTPQTCSKWVYRCESSVLFEQVNENTDLVYTKSKMPLVAQNRDVFAEITWTTDERTGVVRGVGKAVQGGPYQPDYVRIEHAEMIWELSPLPTGKTRVRSFAHVDPAGSVPSWVTNQLSTNIPIKTLSGLKKLLANNNEQTSANNYF